MFFTTNERDAGGAPLEVVDPPPPARARCGRRLTEKNVALWSDFIFRLLTASADLSVADAERVMKRSLSKGRRRVRLATLARVEREMGGPLVVFRHLIDRNT